VFSNFNSWEVIALILLALFIFGPEQLPRVISDGIRMIRKMRGMAQNVANDFSADLGVDNLQDLNPKTFIRKHLLSEEEEAQLRRPLDDIYRDVRQVTEDDLRQLPPPGLGRRSLSAGAVPSPVANDQFAAAGLNAPPPNLNQPGVSPGADHLDPSRGGGRHRARDEDGPPDQSGAEGPGHVSTVEG
jgi:sec-independent protein translocase protein TatB